VVGGPGGGPGSSGQGGWTALSMAASKGHTPVVRLLLDRGADPTIANNDHCTPLLEAFRQGHLETVWCLLDHPSAAATINHFDRFHRTALMCACMIGRVDMVRALLEKGADPTIANDTGRTAMAVAVLYQRRTCTEALKVRCTRRPSTPPLLSGLTEALGLVPAWRGGQEAERAYLLWKARQVADAAGGFGGPAMEGETPEETERRRVEAVPEELRGRVAGGGEGLPGVSLVAARGGDEARDRVAVLTPAVQSLKPGVFEELMELMG
jgi:hypothetical protein